jgi:hypothetical protein
MPKILGLCATPILSGPNFFVMTHSLTFCVLGTGEDQDSGNLSNENKGRKTSYKLLF